MNKEDLIILTSLGFFLRDINENDEIFDSMFNEKQEENFIELAKNFGGNKENLREILTNLIKTYISKLDICEPLGE